MICRDDVFSLSLFKIPDKSTILQKFFSLNFPNIWSHAFDVNNFKHFTMLLPTFFSSFQLLSSFDVIAIENITFGCDFQFFDILSTQHNRERADMTWTERTNRSVFFLFIFVRLQFCSKKRHTKFSADFAFGYDFPTIKSSGMCESSFSLVLLCFRVFILVHMLFLVFCCSLSFTDYDLFESFFFVVLLFSYFWHFEKQKHKQKSCTIKVMIFSHFNNNKNYSQN